MRAALFLLFLAATVPAFSVTHLDDVAGYAQQYESGEINFLQLKMLLSAARESLIQSMQDELVKVNEDEGNARGWRVETAQKLLGEPTQYENWIWIENKQESRRVPEKVAVWRKPLFEGKKIKVYAFANPHAIEQGDTLLRYYWLDFDTRIPGAEEGVDFPVLVEKFKVLFATYSQTGQGLQDIATEAARTEQTMSQQLEQNAGACESYLAGLYKQAPKETEALRWSGKLHESKDGELYLRSEERTESQWHGLNSWVDYRTRGPQNANNAETPQAESREAYRRKSAQELTNELDGALAELHNRGGLAGNYATLSQKVRLAADTLTEKANNKEGGFDIPQYQQLMTSLYQKHTTEFVRDYTKEKRFETELAKAMETVQDRHCEGQEAPCGFNEACANSACVPAKGGNEACGNGADDDGDTLADCEDPDCTDYLPCGKKCEPVCGVEAGCWQCQGEKCRQECDLCGDCQKKNKGNEQACNSVCDACGKCGQANCAGKCEDCWNCEDQYYGSGCRKQCEPCTACNNEKGGGEQCNAECRECNVCQYGKGKLTCPPDHAFDQAAGGCRPTEQAPQQPPEQPDQAAQPPETPQPAQENATEPQRLEPTPEPKTGAPEPNQTETAPVQVTPPPKTEQAQEPTPAPAQKAAPEPAATPAPKIETRAFTPFTGLVTGSTDNACAEIRCSANQFCNPENKGCECAQGYRDCDGDWANGCESNSQCRQCAQDSDCAPQRCSEDKRRLVKFACKAGEPREENRGGANIGAACVTKASGEMEKQFWIGAWGSKFEEFETLKTQAHAALSNEWCRKEFEAKRKERLELQESLDDDFTQWFFKLFVETDVGGFEEHARSFWGVYDAFQRVDGDLARTMSCLGLQQLPEELKPARTSFKSPIGEIEVWEEVKTTSHFGKPVPVLTPYMKIWIFPTKEQFKEEFRRKIREEATGPAPAELEQMRRDPKAMEMIRKVSGTFGGEARILFEVRDGEEAIIRNLNTINPIDLVRVEFVETKPSDVDVTLTADYGFMYSVVESVVKELEGDHIIQPYWEETRPFRIDEAIMPIRIFGKVAGGVMSGNVRVEPIWQLPTIIGLMSEMGVLFTKQ